MTPAGKGGAARASRPVVHRTASADYLVEVSLEAGETVRAEYSLELSQELGRRGDYDERTEEYYGYDGESRWAVYLVLTPAQQAQRHANIDNHEQIAARATRSGTKWTNADHAARGKQRLSLWFEADVVERLDEIVDRTGARSRRDAIETLINEAKPDR